MNYQRALDEYKAGFDESEWKIHECNKAKLKSFARLNFAKDAICNQKALLDKNGVFVKRYRFSAISQIKTNVEVVRSMRMINELLIPILCRQIGLEGAEYFPMVDESKKIEISSVEDVTERIGMSDFIVSKNFLRNGERLLDDLDIYDYCCQSGYNMQAILKELKIMQKKNTGLKIDFEEMETCFFKYVVLGLLTLQLDGHEGNLPIIYNKNDNSLRFGPVFDSEYAFIAKAFMKYDVNKDCFGLFEGNLENLQIEKVIKVFNRCVEKNDYIWTISPNCHRDYQSCMKEILGQAAVSTKAKEILTDIVSNLDVGKAFGELEKIGVTVSPSYQKFTSKIVSYGKAQLVKGLSTLREIGKTEIVSKENVSKNL